MRPFQLLGLYSLPTDIARLMSLDHAYVTSLSGFFVAMNIGWDEIGTLHQPAWGHEIRTDPLWILLFSAMQGHEGSVDDMTTTMRNGHRYGPDDIRTLAMRPDRNKAGDGT